ncbi:class I SAM-dependent methyltransferase [Psychrobacillus sp. NEAU-3TGS]|uniref:class I SAM-dependent methyltransferase n=1 Tax=Psychrobacillus sp. NEAU-3TGS TaxID=2995412 RepID=UPI0024987641|nr:class I SAM-dependent methyltransferase [Psychrobacillus sp. NEAU-3TGS]MDI2589005.1 class I SAM-dependent methyltransferase [Psychrobacillus sp. NEAU-3TGS]
MKTVVTTAGRTNEQFIQKAKEIASELTLPYVRRQKKSMQKLQEEQQANVLVVSKERLELYIYGSTAPFFFHPNSAAFRMKRILNGEKDLLLEALDLQQGDRFLDTTAGLCSDSILASFAVGEEGLVVACEKDEMIAYVVERGLKAYETESMELQESMRRIHIVHQDAVDYLRQLDANSYDVVYMDPMFEEVIEESSNFHTLRAAGVHESLSDEWIEEAKRVAKRRVVLKAHFRSPLFEKYQFEQLTRLTSKFHYGIIDI